MRLLIAEDEKSLAEVLTEILTLNRYSVDTVNDGQEALDYINSNIEYDGIILDIMMPKVDGITVLKTIREQKCTTPVLMLTAKGEVDDKVLGLDSGADDYLTKPFATKELLARIRSITRREKEDATPTLSVGNTNLSSITFELSTEYEVATLTNKEYQLLEMLFSNVGRYISSEKFMEKIWGFDTESAINVVWAHLSSVRKKLTSISSNLKIKSSRNLGYTLEVIDD
ncbi:MAG: response regulator transcription factor [Clostridiales bacterium]|nr:response regulator transcription factor [Clostridiales bacterium]